jgi:tRNA(fMet)-specific endonuclease VapC
MRGDASAARAFDDAAEVVLSAVVLGELTYGAMNSRSPEANLANLERLGEQCTFAPVDGIVVRRYGQVRLALKRKGRPIPENDIWIAATAIALDATLLTDNSHFDEVDGLDLERLFAR